MFLNKFISACYLSIFCLIVFSCGEKQEINKVDSKQNSSVKTKSTEPKQIISKNVKSVNSDCVAYVALWSAGDIAEQIGKDKKWVMFNYKFDLFDIHPSQGSGNIVGKINVSTYGRIIEERDNAYKIESPGKDVGWISAEHVKSISWKNPKTKKLCK